MEELKEEEKMKNTREVKMSENSLMFFKCFKSGFHLMFYLGASVCIILACLYFLSHVYPA